MKEGDIVYIKPEVVDPYFQLKQPRGRIVGWRSLGMIAKVEIFDTASQDSEGHNCVEKFSFHDLSTEPFPTTEPAPSPPTEAAVPGMVWLHGSHWWLEPRGDKPPYYSESELLKQVRQAREDAFKEAAEMCSGARDKFIMRDWCLKRAEQAREEGK